MGSGCLTLLLALGAIIALILFFTGGATDAARDHLNKLVRGDVVSAYEAASPAFRESLSLEAYKSMVASRSDIQQTRSVSIPERGIENGIANITAQLTDSHSVVRSVPMRLRKEGGRWLLIAIDLSAFPSANSPSAPVEPAPISSQSNAPKPARGEPRIGTVVIGSGRNESGALVRPGEAIVGSTTMTLSADIELIDHPLGGGVQVWIENTGNGRRTAPVAATIEGEGSGNMPFDLHLDDEKLPPGSYRLVILLGEDTRFVKEFQVN